MRFMVIGAGMMGPAAAYNAMLDPRVEQIIIADRDPSQLASAVTHLSRFPGFERVEPLTLDLADRAAAVRALQGADAVLTALPWRASVLAIGAALEARVPLVDLAIPGDDDVPLLRQETSEQNGVVVLGAGLEPGLTEMWARRLAEGMDVVDTLQIAVGGVPEVPSGPLRYKIVFGGRELPLRDIPALVVHDGAAHEAQRYSEVERIVFEGAGEFEAWNEGVLPWILDLPEFSALQDATQKTVRWPGYAERASMLLEMGLLGTRPIEVNGVAVVPKQLVDTVLAPYVTMEPGERDLTLFRVDVGGTVGGRRVRRRCDMVDRYDAERGFTSMARTTAFTGAIIARMIARGEVPERGMLTSELFMRGARFDQMVEELAACGVVFETDRPEAGA